MYERGGEGEEEEEMKEWLAVMSVMATWDLP